MVKHYNVKTLYRCGKVNVLADFLSRPPDANFATYDKEERGSIHNENDRDTISVNDGSLIEHQDFEQVQYPHQLNRIDLQCILEYPTQSEILPPNIPSSGQPEKLKSFIINST